MVKEVRHVRISLAFIWPENNLAKVQLFDKIYQFFHMGHDQSCLCQDEARVQKVTKRLHTLEEVNINVKLLTEMLSFYNKESSTDSDKEIIKVCVCVLKYPHTHTHTHTNDEIVNLQKKKGITHL